MKKTEFPEDKWYINSDLKLHYLDWGNLDATPMLLVHGLCCEAHYWDFFARNMRQDYHVIALDQRGHGESRWAENYSPEQYVDDLARFIDKLALKDIVLIGHSLGAINVILYASAHADRVARLVIVDNGPEINLEFIEELKGDLANLPMAFHTVEDAMRQIRELESPNYPNDYMQHLIKHTMKHDESGMLSFKYDPTLRHGELVSLEWLWPYLERIICPVLVVHGVESVLLLQEGVCKMAEKFPNMSSIDIEHAGHFVMGDNPEAFEAAVRNFLSTHIE